MVYVLLCYSGDAQVMYIEGIFTTYDKAMAALEENKIVDDEYNEHYTYDIKEIELDHYEIIR